MVSRFRIRRPCILIVAVVAALVGLSALPVSAQAPAPQRPGAALRPLLRGPFQPIAMQLRGLNLTPPQRQQVLGIFKAHQPDMKALADSARAARARWQQAGQISIQERKDLADRRQAIMSAVRTEVFGVLTPDQRKRLQTRRQRRQVSR